MVQVEGTHCHSIFEVDQSQASEVVWGGLMLANIIKGQGSAISKFSHFGTLFGLFLAPFYQKKMPRYMTYGIGGLFMM